MKNSQLDSTVTPIDISLFQPEFKRKKPKQLKLFTALQLENFLNESLRQSQPHLTANMLGKFNIDSNTLQNNGLTSEKIEQLYRGLFIYSFGFQHALQDIFQNIQNSQEIKYNCWKVFGVLFDQCTLDERKLMFQMIEQEKKELIELITVNAHDQEAQMKKQIAADSETIFNLKQEIEQLTREKKLALEELDSIQGDLKRTQEQFNSEVLLRLQYENKINEIFGNFRELSIKFEKASLELDCLKSMKAINQEEVSTSKTESKKLQLKNEELENKITSQQEENAVLLEEVQDLKQKNIELSNLVNSYQTNNREESIIEKNRILTFELKDARQQISFMENKSEMVNQQINSLKFQYNQKNEELKKLQERSSELEKNLEKTTQKCSNLEKTNINMKQTEKFKENQIASLKSQLGSAEVNNDKLSMEAKKMEIELDIWKEKNRKNDEVSADYQKLVRSINQINTELNKKYEDTLQMILSRETRTKEVEIQINQIQKAFDFQKENFRVRQIEFQNKFDHFKRIEDEKLSENKQLMQAFEQQRKENDDLNQQNIILERQVTRLNIQLSQQEQESSVTKNQLVEIQKRLELIEFERANYLDLHKKLIFNDNQLQNTVCFSQLKMEQKEQIIDQQQKIIQDFKNKITLYSSYQNVHKFIQMESQMLMTVEDLENRLFRLTQKADSQEKLIIELSESNKNLQNSLQKQAQSFSQMSSKVNQKDKELEFQTKELTDLQKDFHQLQKSFHLSEDHCLIITQQNSALKEMLYSSELEIKGLNAKLQKKKQKISVLKNRKINKEELEIQLTQSKTLEKVHQMDSPSISPRQNQGLTIKLRPTQIELQQVSDFTADMDTNKKKDDQPDSAPDGDEHQLTREHLKNNHLSHSEQNSFQLKQVFNKNHRKEKELLQSQNQSKKKTIQQEFKRQSQKIDQLH